ncbi:P1 family peptidase [Nocardia cyriacigeorgica]|uniref:P1 family peptidase n=1 Tax=Nocardia cyriacigeorgica TaxID=135487 RepID=UPI001894C12E|nr:P1 family peptidase [Nocardia cyriacigeorgica]MBF6161045.1 P1 family peptidase [Nocardia cyriacigeorgica]MBF6199844.1 P1 family peptidase [Nocardia cyriacigeorgica]MBF6319558.1 P1 family peptidase [Nocardia cyriacigeorgica]MBF6343638.1 P1 family peptidase [Nocardia cyriacigeorgica]
MTTSVTGVSVGHWSNPVGETGCTVLVLPEGAAASCEMRGGAPASRELDALAPDKMVTAVDAIVLTGGSAFGLASADGVMRYLEERGRGVPAPGGRVPIVPTLALQGAHDGLSRALTPPHTRFDGDGFIAAATGEVDAAVDTVRLMALAAVTEAIRAVGRD